MMFCLSAYSLLAYLHTSRMQMCLFATFFHRPIFVQMQNPTGLCKAHIDVVVRRISVVRIACLRLYLLVFAAYQESFRLSVIIYQRWDASEFPAQRDQKSSPSSSRKLSPT